jgi:DNA-binding NarL/FixJ family response regulator
LKTLAELAECPYYLGMKSSSKDEPTRIRLVLVDDHLLFRESLASLLAAESDFEIVTQCANSLEALKAVKASDVDVVLVDLVIAKEFIKCARNCRYRGKFLVVARSADVTDSAAVLKDGASGIFLESDSSSRLMRAIRLVANGEAWVDQRVIQLLADRFPHYDARSLGNLTDKEQSVLDGVVDGLSNRKIGDQIGGSESSVKATLQQLFTKAGVRTRSQLVRIALEGQYAGKSGDNNQGDSR